MTSFHYPNVRLRRNRYNNAIRSMVAENKITVDDLVYPLFIVDGVGVQEPISALEGQYRWSIDKLLLMLQDVIMLGIKAIAIFPVIDISLKDEYATKSYDQNGLIPRAVLNIKSKYPDLIVFTDVALDPYTIHGHDGIIDKNGYVMNDETNAVLLKQALSHAIAGADFVSPSDMMDGRVGLIRNVLDENGFYNCGIMAYSTKYASSFYGPFRFAVGASGNVNKDKSSYQMNPANMREAILELEMDINEGADIVMIKPGIPYLDIVRVARDKFNRPLAVYHVSGEYAMLKLAANNGLIDYDSAILETMLCCKRAGADIIWTYAALDVARLIS
jgi:porphobilinogen synthase